MLNQCCHQDVSRRRFLCSTMAAVGFATQCRVANGALAGTVRNTRTISQTPHLYCGWPTLTRRTNGELIVVWSGGREQHVCPFGRVDMMRSKDNGETWSWPRTLLDSAIDDRDAGVVETASGALLVTTFSSLAYDEYHLAAASDKKPGEKGAFPKDKLNRWIAAHNRLTPDERKRELGCWMIRSTDGGMTWSKRYSSIVNSPHGPIQLSDGRLLYAGVQLWSDDRQVQVCQSSDDGVSWQHSADIPIRNGDIGRQYHELHAVEASDGTLIVQIRNHNKNHHRETLQCESTDGGKSWSTPHSIGVWGLPSFLLRLNDGRLVMSYGYRRPPFGNQARISEDDGKSWGDPITLSKDGNSGDLGYPSTVQLNDDSLITVWYERMPDSPNAVLRQAHWTV
ncbi:MAG: sialidase family protein [Planctomycetota bacterium]